MLVNWQNCILSANTVCSENYVWKNLLAIYYFGCNILFLAVTAHFFFFFDFGEYMTSINAVYIHIFLGCVRRPQQHALGLVSAEGRPIPS